MHRGRRGRLRSLSLGNPLQEVPCGSGRESDPLLEVWLHRSTELGVCTEELASSLARTGSLWDFGWGMGEGDGTGERLCSRQTELSHPGAQQLSLPLSSSLPAFRAELLTYDLPDAKSCLLSEHTPSVGPLCFCQPDSGSLLGWQAALQPPLPPASPCSAHRLAALTTLFRGPLVCVWLQRLRSANPLTIFWVI